MNGQFQRTHWRFWGVGLLLFFIFLYLIRGILLPFVVGILAAYFLDPAVRKLHQQGLSRSSAASVITIAFFTVAGILGSILAPLIINQLGTVALELPRYMQTLQDKYGSEIHRYIARLTPEQMQSIRDAATNAGSSLGELLSKALPGMLQSGLSILNLLSLIFLTPVVVFYLLRDWDQLVVRLDNMLPRQNAPIIREQLRAIDNTLSGFIRGQTNVCIIMALYYSVTLSLIGLNSGLVLGIMSGLLLFLPFVGYAASFATCLMVGLFQFGWGGEAMSILGIFGLGVMIESGFVTPKLVGGKVGLHPIWIIFGMLAGAALFGFVGILISLPVTAVLGVLVRFAMARYLQSSLYNG